MSEQVSLQNFEPESPADIVGQIQQTAVDAVEAQEVVLDV